MTHIQAIARVLGDYKPHTTAEVYERVCGHSGGLLAIAARICDLRKMGCQITDARDSSAMTNQKGIRTYQMTYIPIEAQVRLGLISEFPALPEKQEQGILFDMSYM